MELSDLLADYQPLHSTYQLIYSIVGKNGETPYGWYQQALREIAARSKTIRSIYASLMDLRREWKKLASIDDPDIEQKKRVELSAARAEAELSVRELARELSVLIPLAEKLKAQVGELTPEKRRNLEEEEWREKLAVRAGMDMLTYGRVSREFIELFRNSSDAVREELLPVIRDRHNQALAAEHVISEPKHLPEITPLSFDEVKEKLALPMNLPALEE